MRHSTHALLYTALLTTLTVVGGLLRIPLGASGFTLQTLFTAMAGVLLGASYGAWSQVVYLALGLIGLPVFLSGGGIGYILQPTFGFLLGLVPCAWVIGKLTANKRDTRHLILAIAVGYGVLYLVGVPYLLLILNGYLGQAVPLSTVLLTCVLPFLPMDLGKLAIAVILCPKILKRLPQLRF